VSNAPQDNGDNEDLEALFDSIVSANATETVSATPQPSPATTSAGATEAASEEVYSRIGQMTRQLHDTLRQLGYDKKLEQAVETLPDAKDRLQYIAAMTEQAAERALNATEIARPLQEKLQTGAAELSMRWKKLFDNQLSIEDFKDLATKTRDYLDDVPKQTKATSDQLLEIMMAQDFQDLTGQVIKKTIDMAQDIEQQMLQLLLMSTPMEKRADVGSGLLNGPVINADGRTDVVTNQQQVDDLLESLGF
jgi:chemotaxis protein CheZ